MTVYTLYRAPGLPAGTRSDPGAAPSAPMVDSYGRSITYLLLSVTDRCDLRST